MCRGKGLADKDDRDTNEPYLVWLQYVLSQPDSAIPQVHRATVPHIPTTSLTRPPLPGNQHILWRRRANRPAFLRARRLCRNRSTRRKRGNLLRVERRLRRRPQGRLSQQRRPQYDDVSACVPGFVSVGHGCGCHAGVSGDDGSAIWVGCWV